MSNSLKLREKEDAPNFETVDQDGGTFVLEDKIGKYVVLYFYPKDSTPGCMLEANQFNALLPQFRACGAIIAGVSADNKLSHKRFSDSCNLAFPLLVDTTFSICDEYGVRDKKQMFGKTYTSITRTTFLISPSSNILKIWQNVKADGHANAVLLYLQSIIK